MEAQTFSSPFTKGQIELLKLFSRDLDDADILEIKRLIVKYLAEKATRMADEIWDEKGWTNEDMDKLAHTHMRTSYEPKTKK